MLKHRSPSGKLNTLLKIASAAEVDGEKTKEASLRKECDHLQSDQLAKMAIAGEQGGSNSIDREWHKRRDDQTQEWFLLMLNNKIVPKVFIISLMP